MSLKYVGKNITRPDAVQKATGKARFLADIKLPGMLYAAILRPGHAHARIVSIDTSEAEKCEGVVKVITGKGCSQKYRYGDNIRDFVPMADEKVRYIGEPLAAVIAKNPHQAKEALKKITVQVHPLPVYTQATDALADGATLIHEASGDYWHLPGVGPKPGTNIATHYRLKKGDAAKGFAESDVVVEAEFKYPFGSCAAIEPHGSIVWFHEDGMIEIWSSSICPFIIREEVARVYDRPESDVRVHIPEVGGCFGYKSDITVEQTVAYIASFVPGHPVKWVATRKEDFTSTLLGHGMVIRMKIGAKKDGKLMALATTVYHSTGAYADTGLHVSIAAAHNSTGAYEYPNCDLETFLTYTNTPPIGAWRGYGHPEAQFAQERLIEILARKLGMDRFALREKNYLGPGKITSLGEHLWETNGSIQKCVDVVKRTVFDKPRPPEDPEYYYGRGFAAIMKSPKGAPFSSKGAYLKFNADGSVVINCGGAEVGQGLRNVVRLVAAETLKMPPERIHVYTEIDTQFSPWEWQTIGSMFTKQGGRAVWRACLKAIAQMKQTASQVLRCDVDLLDYDGEYVFLASDPSVKVEVTKLVRGYMYENGMVVGEVVQACADARLPRYSGFDPATGQGSMGVSYTFGAQAAEIRIEKKTGKIIVDHFASCFDVGRVIQPQQIRGQVTGGVVMTVGAALCEEVRFDQDGKCVNPLFRKYRFPTIKDAPKKQTVDFVETPGVIGPYGARGIGEHPVIGPPPAILNAIHDATGIDFFEIPVTPEKMKKALDEKGSGGEK
ncbi:MAG: xanthine dehydrogenase family protein molybdopterin-binding subunit [Candidatus Riflebacteria bacterium]|nr:xanthine dehydrogenase family protein molybdopterin-binding subunit [Candidatus Riflebacteria bacterium]